MDNSVLTDHTPPQNLEAEKAVLGAIFLSTDALVDALEYLTPEDFYRREHQIIFQSMMDLNDRDEAIDVVTITDRLTAKNELDDVGGVTYIAELAGAVPTAANATYYAKIVQEKAILRRLIQTATNIATQGYQQDGDVSDLLDNAERDIMGVAETRNQSGFKPIREVLNSSFEEINQLSEQAGNGSRQSGMWVLDQFTRWQSLNWDFSGKLQKAQMDVDTVEPELDFRLPPEFGGAR